MRKVSAHYTVDEDGTIYAHVPEECRAWHAGVSYWAGARDINARSIGIEIVNPGHEFGYRSFPGRADRSGDRAGARYLSRAIRFRPNACSAIPMWRRRAKRIPASCFPGARLSLAGIGSVAADAQSASLPVPFADGLRAFGYGFAPDMDVARETAIEAFQRHWRPGRIDGVADTECEAILAALLHRD